MKISNILLLTALATSAITSSCQKDNTLGKDDGSPVAAQFSSSISGQLQAKVSGNSWDANDAIGVFMKKGAGLAAALESNKKYTTASSNGNFSAADNSQTIYFPTDGSAVDFVAYYPFQQNLNGNIFPVNVSSQTSQAAIDLLYSSNANNITKNNPSTALTFDHQLSKLEFSIKKGAGVNSLDGLSASIAGTKTTADFDLATGILTAKSTVADISAKTTALAAQSVVEAILIPTADASGTVVTFSLSGKVYKLNIPTGTSFEKGKKYAYDIELRNDGTTPTGTAAIVTASINNWTDVPSGNHVLNPDGTPTDPTDPTEPSTGEEQSLFKEGFGNADVTSRPKIGMYTGFENSNVTFTDAKGNADIRVTGSLNNHVWLPSAKDALLTISGIKTTGASDFKLKYDIATNLANSEANVITVNFNGKNYTAKSTVLATTNEFKTVEITLTGATANENSILEFVSLAGTNKAGFRIDNIELLGKK